MQELVAASGIPPVSSINARPVVAVMPAPLIEFPEHSPAFGEMPELEQLELRLPRGMYDESVWTRLVAMPGLLSGIVFTVCCTQPEPPPGAAKQGSRGVGRLMDSLLGDNDFGCRLSESEWVFVFPVDDAGLNRYRADAIPEKLWDFQLRRLGVSAVSFRWGAAEIHDTKLIDGYHAAHDRMNREHGPGSRSLSA
jgi:hypothetical protein